MRLKPLIFPAMLALAGCAKEPPAPTATPAPTFKASCSTPALGVCTEYMNDAFVLGEEVLKTGCLETKGTWSPAHCPTEKKLGGCALAGQLRVYYPGGELDYSPASAQQDCTALFQGRWVASR